MEDFKALAPIKKQMALMTIQVLYENGLHEDQVVEMLKKSYMIVLSQETIRHFYNGFVRADLNSNTARDLLLEFSGS